MADQQAPPAADGTAEPPGPAPAPAPPGFAWRSVVAVLVVGLTVVGSVALTDDSWPFAPFRMFARAVKPDGRVVKVDFVGTTASGRSVRLDASAFGLRRAEVEGQQVQPGRRLTDDQMAALARTWNEAHPDDPLVRLEFRRLGRELVGGEPVSSFTETIQTWDAT